MTALEELYLVLVHIQLITRTPTTPPRVRSSSHHSRVYVSTSPILSHHVRWDPPPPVASRRARSSRALTSRSNASSPIARGLSYAAPWTRYCRPPMAVMAPTMMANGGTDSTGCSRRRQTVSHSSFIHSFVLTPRARATRVVVVVVERDARKSSRRAWHEGKRETRGSRRSRTHHDRRGVTSREAVGARGLGAGDANEGRGTRDARERRVEMTRWDA